MRQLGDELNTLTIQDNISNSTIRLFYRTPTPQERIGYDNEVIQRKRNKVITRLGQTRLKYGTEILMGFRTGDFVRKIGDREVPISSEPGSENYDPEWKNTIKKYASDLVIALAVHVFESSTETGPDEEDGEEEPEAPEDAEKN